MPPPPPGGTPPPPPGQYGQPAGAPQGQNVDVAAAFTWGWKKFQEHLGAIAIAIAVLIGAMIVFGLIGFVISGLVSGMFSSTDIIFGVEVETGPGLFGTLIANFFLQIFTTVAYSAASYGLIRGILAITQGRAPTTAEMFDMSKFLPFLLASILVSVVTSIGFVLCFFPGLIAMFLFWLTPYYVADKGLEPVAAMKASYETMIANAGTMIMFFLATLIAIVIGALLCGLGLIVAIPVNMLAGGYMYRAVNGEPIAP